MAMGEKKVDYEKLYYQAMDEMQRAGLTQIDIKLSRAEIDLISQLVSDKLNEHVSAGFMNEELEDESEDPPKYRSKPLADHRKQKQEFMEDLLTKLIGTIMKK